MQMIVEPKEDKGSLLWKTVEQFYRFGVGSIAGGEFNTIPSQVCTRARPALIPLSVA